MKYLHTYNCSAALKCAQDSGNSAEDFSAAQEANTGLCTKESAVGKYTQRKPEGICMHNKCVCLWARTRIAGVVFKLVCVVRGRTQIRRSHFSSERGCTCSAVPARECVGGRIGAIST